MKRLMSVMTLLILTVSVWEQRTFAGRRTVPFCFALLRRRHPSLSPFWTPATTSPMT